MKNVIFVCFMAFASISLLQANGDSTPGDKGARLSFEMTTVDYGTVTKDSDPVRFFNFTNTGDQPLIIMDAKGSCGCTVPSFPKDAIAPGKTAQIEVRYDTKRVGVINKTITIISNAGDPVLLQIRGEVVATN
ncbi:MAG: DUF1573 domain-containing protein [Saprospiraceae bacterium]